MNITGAHDPTAYIHLCPAYTSIYKKALQTRITRPKKTTYICVQSKIIYDMLLNFDTWLTVIFRLNFPPLEE